MNRECGPECSSCGAVVSQALGWFVSHINIDGVRNVLTPTTSTKRICIEQVVRTLQFSGASQAT